VGDEAPAVRVAALRAASTARGATVDAVLPALLAGLADAHPDVSRAAAAAVATAAPARLDSLRAAVTGLLAAAATGRAAPAAARAALAALGAAAGAAAAPLAADLMGTRTGFLQREPSVDDESYAHRLIFLTSAASTAPCVGAALPAHAADAAALLAARHVGLGLPRSVARRAAGGVRVVSGAHKRARDNDDDPAWAVAAAATERLAAAAGLPRAKRAAALRRADAVLAPAAAGGCAAAAAARLHLRALGVHAEGEAGGDARLPHGWDGGPREPPPLADCLRPAPAGALALLASRLAAVGCGDAAAAWRAVAAGAADAAPPTLALPPPAAPLPDGALTAPGGPNTRPLAATAGLPVRLEVRAWVAACGPRPSAWLRVSGAGLETRHVRLRVKEDEKSDSGGRVEIAVRLDLPPPPAAPAATLTLALVIALPGGGGRARLGPELALELRVAAPTSAHAAAGARR
jgi:hypothetical protein